jgi:hypothetical protein
MIRGRNIAKGVLTAGNRIVFDLSGSAAGEMVLLSPKKTVKITGAHVVYIEASSADTGVAITIGATSGGTEYLSTTSLVSQAAGTVSDIAAGDFTLTTVPAGGPIWIAHAGGKVGAGTCFVVITYEVN